MPGEGLAGTLLHRDGICLQGGQPASSDCGLPPGGCSPWSLGRGLVGNCPWRPPCLADLQTCRPEMRGTLPSPGFFGDANSCVLCTKGPGWFGRCCSQACEASMEQCVQRKRKPAGGDTSLILQVPGVGGENICGKTWWCSQSRDRNCPLQNTCTLLGAPAPPHFTPPIPDIVFLPECDRGRS